MELISFKRVIDLKGFTLLIPSVSVGNVGQLTIDLVISTCNLKRVATLWHPGIVPTVGANPFTPHATDICTACELYANEALKVAAIQLRSTIDIKLAQEFFQELKTAIIKLEFKDVVILASTFSYELRHIESSHFRYVGNDPTEMFPSLHVLPMETDDVGRGVIEGSGFALKLYGTLKDDVRCTILVKYVSEGDNRPDAMAMLNLLFKCTANLQAQSVTAIVFPSSWEHVFGNPPPIGIF